VPIDEGEAGASVVIGTGDGEKHALVFTSAEDPKRIAIEALR
jgi:hypothetical protein